MRVSARIKPGSAIDKSWRHLGRIGGDVSGVRFRLFNDEYLAGEIPPGALDALSRHSSVIVSLMMEPTGTVKVVDIPLDTVQSDSVESPELRRPRGRPRKNF